MSIELSDVAIGLRDAHRHNGEIAVAIAKRKLAALLGRRCGDRDPDRVRLTKNQAHAPRPA
jgi:hypothetical protein